MGWFNSLFNRKQLNKDNAKSKDSNLSERDLTNSPSNNFLNEWEPVPAYIEADPADYELVSVIATAIAAGDRPNSQFVVKKIYQRNPEAQTVSLIAASLAAGALDDSQFVVKSIHQKRK